VTLTNTDGDTQGKNPTVLSLCRHQLSPEIERRPSASILSLLSGLLTHAHACYLPLLDSDADPCIDTNPTKQLTVEILHTHWKGWRARVNMTFLECHTKCVYIQR